MVTKVVNQARFSDVSGKDYQKYKVFKVAKSVVKTNQDLIREQLRSDAV